MSKRIGWSVGHKGKNFPRDVKCIQILLNRHYATGTVGIPKIVLKVDGKCGPKTINAIRDYQSTVMRMRNPDARVDPHGPTIRQLSLNWYHKNDEACKILDYIIAEIKTNITSEAVKKMRKYNSFSTSKCIAEWKKEPLLNRVLTNWGGGGCTDQLLHSKSMALILWTEKVRAGGNWDHKPKISSRFKYRVLSHQTQERHILGDYTYYYDIWSNIHYGYVGAAAGFSESELLDGAGAEQVVSTLLGGDLPKKNGKGLRGWDDESDRVSVRIGIELYNKNPSNVTAIDVLEKIKKAGNELDRKDYFTY